MKTLEEIKEEYAIKIGFEDWIDMLRNTGDWVHDTAVDVISKEYAKEVSKEALKNASEKIQLMMYYIDEEDTTNVDILNFKHRRIQSCYAVPKQSILNESNIPKL